MIAIYTNQPQALLDAIYKEIDDWKIRTWVYNKERDFTHLTSDGQWEGRAWLRPVIPQSKDLIRFGIIFPDGKPKELVVYSVFHGRFIEMLITHFGTQFSLAGASSSLATPDVFKTGDKLV